MSTISWSMHPSMSLLLVLLLPKVALDCSVVFLYKWSVIIFGFLFSLLFFLLGWGYCLFELNTLSIVYSIKLAIFFYGSCYFCILWESLSVERRVESTTKDLVRSKGDFDREEVEDDDLLDCKFLKL